MRLFAIGVVGLVSLVGCATQVDDGSYDSTEAEAKGGDSGTSLSTTVLAGAQTCLPSGDVSVAIEGILTSNASSAWAEVTIAIDGGAAQTIDEVQPTEFTHGGKVKTYDYSYDVTVSAGATHTVEICFIQPSGHTRMTACNSVTFTAQSCTAGGTCESHADGPFGDTVGNHNLCHGKLDNNVEVQVKGDFGDTATLTVSGPNGFGFSTPIDRSGQSCVYHYNWATRDGNNGGAGTYTLSVSGNENTETWYAQLFCL